MKQKIYSDDTTDNTARLGEIADELKDIADNGGGMSSEAIEELAKSASGMETEDTNGFGEGTQVGGEGQTASTDPNFQSEYMDLVKKASNGEIQWTEVQEYIRKKNEEEKQKREEEKQKQEEEKLKQSSEDNQSEGTDETNNTEGSDGSESTDTDVTSKRKIMNKKVIKSADLRRGILPADSDEAPAQRDFAIAEANFDHVSRALKLGGQIFIQQGGGVNTGSSTWDVQYESGFYAQGFIPPALAMWEAFGEGYTYEENEDNIIFTFTAGYPQYTQPLDPPKSKSNVDHSHDGLEAELDEEEAPKPRKRGVITDEEGNPINDEAADEANEEPIEASRKKIQSKTDANEVEIQEAYERIDAAAA